ncbi:MAG: exopolysaccharide biosynthesis protein [Cypionkella sp.]|nr:exopolysaccharide biosynthesis protein [Cypionkella sp.]
MRDADQAEMARSLGEILTRLRRAAEGADRVSVEDMAGAMGASSIIAMLLVPAILLISPLSGIPGLSSLGGIVIALVSVQIVLGRDHAWLPGVLRRLSLPAARLMQALDWLERPAAWFDRKTARWGAPQPSPAVWRVALGAVCLMIGLVIPFMELIPFSATLAATIVALLALSILLNSTRLALLGFALPASALAGVIAVLD